MGKIQASSTYLTAPYLENIIRIALGSRLASNQTIWLADEEYFLPPFADMVQLLRRTRLQTRQWYSNRFDCDDFAFVLKAAFCDDAYRERTRRAAHAMGIVWGYFPMPHAINWVVTDDGSFRFIEPQTDEVFLPSNQQYSIFLIVG